MLSALRRLRPAQLLELATDACRFFLKVLDVVLEVPGAPAASRQRGPRGQPGRSRGVLRDAIASFWKYGAGPGADRGERYGLLCSSLAMASARAVVLAAGGAVTDRGGGAVAGRGAAGAGRGVPRVTAGGGVRDPIARTVPHLLAMCCVGHLGCQPVLTGPSVLERVLVDALPRAAVAPGRFGRAVPQAVRAWAGWVAERHKLTHRSRRRLGFSLRAALVRLAGT